MFGMFMIGLNCADRIVSGKAEVSEGRMVGFGQAPKSLISELFAIKINC